jgi:glycolate oxidase
MLRDIHDLADVAGVVGELSIERLPHGLRLAPDRDGAPEVAFRERLHGGKQGLPAVFPFGEQSVVRIAGENLKLGDAKLNEDIVVPVRNYVKFAQFLARLKRESVLPVPTFGHLADGNLHVNIMYCKAVPAECRAAEKAVRRLMEMMVAMDGAISGEHGIGLAKTPFLRIQHSPAQVRAMRAVKAAPDPRGILNPGKMFDVFEVSKHPRLEVKLPWDHK